MAQADNAINSIEINVFGNGTTGYQSSKGQTVTVAANNQNSWNEQTISGTLGSQFVNAYGNPNTGLTYDTLWQVPEGGTPTALGDFWLTTAEDGDAILTFNPVPEPEPGLYYPPSVCWLSFGAIVFNANRHKKQQKHHNKQKSKINYHI